MTGLATSTVVPPTTRKKPLSPPSSPSPLVPLPSTTFPSSSAVNLLLFFLQSIYFSSSAVDLALFFCGEVSLLSLLLWHGFSYFSYSVTKQIKHRPPSHRQLESAGIGTLFDTDDHIVCFVCESASKSSCVPAARASFSALSSLSTIKSTFHRPALVLTLLSVSGLVSQQLELMIRLVPYDPRLQVTMSDLTDRQVGRDEVADRITDNASVEPAINSATNGSGRPETPASVARIVVRPASDQGDDGEVFPYRPPPTSLSPSPLSSQSLLEVPRPTRRPRRNFQQERSLSRHRRGITDFAQLEGGPSQRQSRLDSFGLLAGNSFQTLQELDVFGP